MHVFVRHPPLPALAGVCYGHLDAMPEPGAIEAAAAALAPRLPGWPIASSPSRRCLLLARALHAMRTGASADEPIHVEPRLRELHFGDWEGVRWDDLPRASLDAWSRDVAGHAPPGGESFVALIARVRAALDGLRVPHVVVTHAGVVRAALHLAGMPQAEAAAAQVAYLEPLRIGDA